MGSFFVAAFLLLAFLVVYILGGYPILLNWLAGRFGKPIDTPPQFKTVSILIAVFNGESVIGDKLRSVINLNYPKHLLEIIVLSDGSTDGTDAVVQEFASEGIQLVKLPRGGKPAALNAGIARST